MFSNVRPITNPDSGHLPNLSIILTVPVQFADGILPSFVGCFRYTFSGRGDSTSSTQAQLTIHPAERRNEEEEVDWYSELISSLSMS
jgi:hypothetical protein